MSQATVARKERRKRFIAKLKQQYERSPVHGLRTDNTHLCQQNMFQEIIAATQQACIASFTQGCDYAKIIHYPAFQDGFLAGYEQARTSQANMAHAPTQTVDTSDASIQTDWVQQAICQAEIGMTKDSNFQSRNSSSMTYGCRWTSLT